MGAARPARDAELEVRLLGPLEVLKDGRPVALGGPKPRTLLATLALESGRVVSVDRLVENLWPASAPETALHAVQVYVAQLRKTLGRQVIAKRPPGYGLELESDCIDVNRFARLVGEGRAALQAGSPETAEPVLREALTLWRGPALADFLYEPFAQGEIARLEELRLVALEERIDTDLELGRHLELAPELEALVQAEPLRERPRGQLMLALYRSGRQADALAAYRAAREALVEELGIEPGPELKELEAAILRQDDSLLPETVAVAPSMQYRRLVTVLFADVVDSLALAESLDPETLHGVLRRYFELVSAVLQRHGGTVEKFAGDAVMAVFGVPVSHEDDALRAARAAIEIQAGIAALNEALASELGIRLDVRVGIAAGEVLVVQEGARRRLVTGETVGVAKRLEAAAAPGEIVVGEVVHRLVGNAARFEELGLLEVKGRSQAIAHFRLLEIAPAAPAFERRQEAPFVGRRKELGVLRKALRAAKSESKAQLVAILGPAGIGKSRLAFEVVRRAKAVIVLSGRCLSYGDGITYWPLRDMLRDAPESEERDAVLAALDADTPPHAGEIAWIFRRLCEELAREKPLVLVFDDVHWAEPTLLELVEQLADRGAGPMLLVCAAREELVEEHPEFLAERSWQIVLDTLTPEETDALLDGLGAALTDLERAHVVETAGGNPLFVEQLLALAAEGLGESGAMPATIQALLAARLDRLGPGERAVLERGAVIGEEFTADAVAALLEPATAPTVPAHLATLAGRGFVRSAGEEFRFRHVLVQEAVYRAAPKRLRAELHERFADRLDETAADLPERDELSGYHLERAYGLRRELGDSGSTTERLSENAGRRLGAAGMRAWRRGDASATLGLLGRATRLLPADDSQRLDLLCELALAQRANGSADAAHASLTLALNGAARAGDVRVELRARIETLFFGVLDDGGSEELLEVANRAIPIFETLADHRALGRAWLLVGWVRGGIRAEYEAWTAAAEQALVHYRLAGSPASTCLGQIAAALYWGPTPVGRAIGNCEALLEETTDLDGRANVLAYLGGLEAQQGAFEHARAHVAEARSIYDDLGQLGAITIHCDGITADIDMAAAEYARASETLRAMCRTFAESDLGSELATRAADLAEAAYLQGDLVQAEQWVEVSRTNSTSEYVGAEVSWRTVAAKILARRRRFENAKATAQEAILVSQRSDGLNRTAKAYRDLGEVLLLAGREEEASAAFDRAVDLFERKENDVGAARTRAMRKDLVTVQ